MNIFAIIGTIICVIFIGFFYFEKYRWILDNNIFFMVKNLKIPFLSIFEMNLKNEDKIKELTQVIIDSLEYSSTYYNNPKDVIREAYYYAIELCKVLEIEVTPGRNKLILECINIAFSNIYIENIE